MWHNNIYDIDEDNFGNYISPTQYFSNITMDYKQWKLIILGRITEQMDCVEKFSTKYPANNKYDNWLLVLNYLKKTLLIKKSEPNTLKKESDDANIKLAHFLPRPIALDKLVKEFLSYKHSKNKEIPPYYINKKHNTLSIIAQRYALLGRVTKEEHNAPLRQDIINSFENRTQLVIKCLKIKNFLLDNIDNKNQALENIFTQDFRSNSNLINTTIKKLADDVLQFYNKNKLENYYMTFSENEFTC